MRCVPESRPAETGQLTAASLRSALETQSNHRPFDPDRLKKTCLEDLLHCVDFKIAFCNDPFQPAVLFFQIPKTTDVRNTHLTKLLLPWYQVCSETPCCLQTSATVRFAAASIRNVLTINSSFNRFFFGVISPMFQRDSTGKY